MQIRKACLTVLAGLALVTAACGGDEATATEVNVTLTEMRVVMDLTTIPAGPIKFVITNEGSEVHEVVLEPAGSNDAPFELEGAESEVEDIQPGATETFEWTLDEPGKYQLACHIVEGDEDHFLEGMVTVFDVEA